MKEREKEAREEIEIGERMKDKRIYKAREMITYLNSNQKQNQKTEEGYQ